MEVAQLERSRKSNNQGYEFIAQASLSLDRVAVLITDGGCMRPCRYPACEWAVVVDVILQEVKEWIRNKVNRAVEILLDSKIQLQGSSGLVAFVERYIL